MSNFTQEEIDRAKVYYQRQMEAMRPMPTPEDIKEFEAKKKAKTANKLTTGE